MRFIGSGHSSAKKLCDTLNMTCMTKSSYRLCERMFLAVATSIAKDAMKESALEVKKITKSSSTAVAECSVSFEGT
ncbi:hypothetical protein TNCV_3867181 [Trichonephila clavipes]|nr:hypothetical protein TNCV_3867181 [Trichonephila clavipes]